MIEAMHRAAVAGSFRDMQRNTWRYGALNMTSLSKYGSLEFRSLGTPSDVREVEAWVKILLSIFDAAGTFEKGTSMIEDVSIMGASRFLSRVLGDMAPVLLSRVDINVPSALMEGVRQAQDIAYTYEFSRWKHPEDAPKTTSKRKTRRSMPHTFDIEQDIGGDDACACYFYFCGGFGLDVLAYG